jgi:hypothetical protein
MDCKCPVLSPGYYVVPEQEQQIVRILARSKIEIRELRKPTNPKEKLGILVSDSGDLNAYLIGDFFICNNNKVTSGSTRWRIIDAKADGSLDLRKQGEEEKKITGNYFDWNWTAETTKTIWRNMTVYGEEKIGGTKKVEIVTKDDNKQILSTIEYEAELRNTYYCYETDQNKNKDKLLCCKQKLQKFQHLQPTSYFCYIPASSDEYKLKLCYPELEAELEKRIKKQKKQKQKQKRKYMEDQQQEKVCFAWKKEEKIYVIKETGDGIYEQHLLHGSGSPNVLFQLKLLMSENGNETPFLTFLEKMLPTLPWFGPKTSVFQDFLERSRVPKLLPLRRCRHLANIETDLFEAIFAKKEDIPRRIQVSIFQEKYNVGGIRILWNTNEEQWFKFSAEVELYRKQQQQGIPDTKQNSKTETKTLKRQFWDPSLIGSSHPSDLFLAWHGTSVGNIRGIASSSLDPLKKPKNGRAQGIGCYVSGNLRSALTYAPEGDQFSCATQNIQEQKGNKSKKKFHYICLVMFLRGKVSEFSGNEEMEMETSFTGDYTCIRNPALLHLVSVLEIDSSILSSLIKYL